MKKCNNCNKEKPLSDFYKQSDRKNGASSCKACFNLYCQARWVKRKKQAIEYKGGKCKKCGLKDHYSVFAFHHRFDQEKEFMWNKLRLKSWDKIVNEIDKCDLLCHNCHAKTHWEIGKDHT